MDATYNTETLALHASLSAYSLLYDLEAGVLRAQMRATPGSPLLLYEWATPNDTRGQARGRIDLLPLSAQGLIAFEANPQAGDVVSFGSRTLTFVSGSAGAFQVALRSTLGGTLSALRDVLEASTDPDLVQCDYGVSGHSLLVSFKTAGALGNAFELDASGAGITLSGATLREGGHAVTLAAPLSDVASFRGTYAFDLRYERDVGGGQTFAKVLMTRGLTFDQGVTR